MGSFINDIWYIIDVALMGVGKGWLTQFHIRMRKMKLDFQPHTPSLPTRYTHALENFLHLYVWTHDIRMFIEILCVRVKFLKIKTIQVRKE